MIARTWRGTVHRADADEYAEYIRGRCWVASTQGRLKADPRWDQIAKTSSSTATATRRLMGSSTASS